MKRTTFGTDPDRGRLGSRKALHVACCMLAMVLILSGTAAKGAPASGTPSTWQKSVTLQSRWPDDFAGAGSDAAIAQAQRANANHLTLIIPYQQDNIYSTAIYKASYAPTDAALIHAVKKAHSLGMRVTFKLHLDPNDGQWRAMINPSDRDTWFRNYSGILNYYASLAQQHQVEQMIVGAELISMATLTSNADNTQRWRGMIAQVRQRFSGTLTYSANWGGSYFSEEFAHIGFWDALDFIGISAYFELANYDNPSVSQLMDGWNYWNTNKIRPFQQSLGKPVLFTEVGYRSVDGAAIQPWNWSKGGNYNPQEQVNAINAMLQYWSDYPWFAGLHYWSWHSDPNCCGPGDTSYEVQNKPGYDAMRTGFLGSSGDTGGVIAFTSAGANVSPGSGPAGSSFTLSASIKASSASSALIDMEVYDAAGNKVYQQFAGNQSFTAGQTRNFSFTWASPSSQPSGQYTLSIGVFANDWTTNYLWVGNAASFAIGGAGPIATATPTRTATATPTTGAATPTRTPLPATATPTPVATQSVLEIWWPTNGVTVSGVQPFKARLSNLDLSQYTMYWQVDGGTLNIMPDNFTDGPHKEASVSVAGWNWRGSGPYTLNFVAKNAGGSVLQQKSIQINVQN